MTAIFWGTFAATRGFAIVLAMVAKPALVMWGSYAISLVGAILLSIFANSSPAALYFGTAMMGIGCASIFPTGFLWMEQRIVITSKVRNQHKLEHKKLWTSTQVLAPSNDADCQHLILKTRAQR